MIRAWTGALRVTAHEASLLSEDEESGDLMKARLPVTAQPRWHGLVHERAAHPVGILGLVQRQQRAQVRAGAGGRPYRRGSGPSAPRAAAPG